MLGDILRCFQRESKDPPSTVDQSLLIAHRMWLDGACREAGLAFCSIAPTTVSEARFAIGGAMQAAASLLKAGISPPPAVTVPCNGRPAISAIVCSITPDKLAAVTANLADAFARFPFELIPIRDARSLAEGYNRGFQQACGELVVFCHDDIELLHPDAGERLVRSMQTCDLLGCAGTSLLRGDRWLGSGFPHAHGWVVHGTATPLAVGCYSLARRAQVQALDGAFLMARRSLVECSLFDALAFDGFHLYDLDFSFRAHRDGARVRVETGAWLRHASAGRYDDQHARYGARFLHKFALGDGRAAGGMPGWSVAADADTARSLYGWLEAWMP